MQVCKDMNWINNKLFDRQNPRPFTIVDVTETKKPDANLYDLNLFLQDVETKEVYVMSVFKENKNILIIKYGEWTEKWINQKVLIRLEIQDGKSIKLISPI